MSLSLEHIDACLPITAVRTLSLHGVDLVIYGQGPYTRLVAEATGLLLAQFRTFKRNNVHGFVINEQIPQSGAECEAQILAWGGQSARVLRLVHRKDDTGSSEVYLSAGSAEYAAPDWILDACASHEDDNRSRAYLVTAHNALLTLDMNNYTTGIHLQQLATGVKSVLYSADVIALSATHVLVAAGTVFGEIIVWSYFLDEDGNFPSDHSASIHHFFTGHEGSIFGVDISPEIPALRGDKPGRLLASCSDDRTVRVWDITDCCWASRQDPPAYSTDGFDLRTTGFGNSASDTPLIGSEVCVAKAFGHAARIWGIHFLYTSSEPSLSLISRGEDATCQLWKLTWGLFLSSEPNFELQNISILHRHTGKHIWALDVLRTTTRSVIYTGGADGALRGFELGADSQEIASTGPSAKARDSLVQTDGRIRLFAFIADDCFIASTDQGDIRLGRLGSGSWSGVEQTPQISWETICMEDDLRSFSITSSLMRRGIAVVGNASGLIRLYDHRSKSINILSKTGRRPLALHVVDCQTGDSCGSTTAHPVSIIATYATSDQADLFVVKTLEAATLQVDVFQLALPSTFKVSASLPLCSNRYMVLGSKTGALAVYDTSVHTGEPLQPILCIRRVHGTGVVTYLTRIISITDVNGALLEYFLTCGRDGNYSLHVLKVIGGQGGPVSLKTIHRSSPSFGQTIEGAYFDGNTGELMLYGFRGSEFVLWNESTRSELLSIYCGGVHRNWAYCHYQNVTGSGALLWNQAASLHAFRPRTLSLRTLRAGSHGREIKCLGVANVTGTLFATGAEDTTLRIFKTTASVTDSPWGAFECVRVLNKHSTGLQQVTWSKDGKFLFTSAGYEEFFVWRIRSVPVFGLAAIQEASSPKEDPKSDLRITSFDVLDVEGHQGEHCFLFCLAYSNSMVKIFHYSSSEDAVQFKLLAKGTYMTNCLTQAHFFLTGSSINLITCATDGYFTIWHLDSVLRPHFSVTSSNIIPTSAFLEHSVDAATISWSTRHRIHLNSIKSVEYIDISETTKLMVAGGDDNALSVSLVNLKTVDFAEDAEITTISIPDAHASSITTIKLVQLQQSSPQSESSERSFLVASSGNDHRIRIWSISVDLEKAGAGAVTVVEKVNRYSPVADISSMDVIQAPLEANGSSPSNDKPDMKLLVCGVGMEMLDIRLR